MGIAETNGTRLVVRGRHFGDEGSKITLTRKAFSRRSSPISHEISRLYEVSCVVTFANLGGSAFALCDPSGLVAYTSQKFQDSMGCKVRGHARTNV